MDQATLDFLPTRLIHLLGFRLYIKVGIEFSHPLLWCIEDVFIERGRLGMGLSSQALYSIGTEGRVADCQLRILLESMLDD